MALNTKGSPAILLLEMLKLMSLTPMAVIKSERQVEDAALREEAVDGWGEGVMPEVDGRSAADRLDCSDLPLMYIMPAQKKVTKNCPSTHFQSFSRNLTGILTTCVTKAWRGEGI
jgi:hypothetical protein